MTAPVGVLALAESLRATADRLAALPVDPLTELADLGFNSLTIYHFESGVTATTLRPFADEPEPAAGCVNGGNLHLGVYGQSDAPTALAELLALARQVPAPGAEPEPSADPETPAFDLPKVLADHRKWLAGEGGQRANLSGAYLYGADLSVANLRFADLTGANLTGANLTGADLTGADLSGADLSGADLRGANLTGADLSDADLYGADLYGADLYGANLTSAYLRGADLSDADLRDADLTSASGDTATVLPPGYAVVDGLVVRS